MTTIGPSGLTAMQDPTCCCDQLVSLWYKTGPEATLGLQQIRPNTDDLLFSTNPAGWEKNPAAAANYFSLVADAVPADDNRFIQTTVDVAENAICRFGLTNPTTVPNDTNHSIRIRIRLDVGTSPQMTPILKQGVSTIFTGTPITIAGGFTNYDFTIPEATAATITDYNDLFIELFFENVGVVQTAFSITNIYLELSAFA